jgi:hypothetical protein
MESVNGSAEFSVNAVELGVEGEQEERTALHLLRLQLHTTMAKVARLEVAFQKQRAFWRREVAYAAIIGGLVVLSAVLGFSLALRLL